MRHFFQILWSFRSFHFVYLIKAHMKLNGRKWLDEMYQRDSEKNQMFLILDDKWQVIFKNLGQCSILYRKGTFYEKGSQKIYSFPPPTL